MEKANSKIEEKDIINKLLDLILVYENESSKNWIELVSHKLKVMKFKSNI